MDFRLLGPLEAGADAAPLRLGGRKPRALLACLLLDANRTVSVEQLVDELWGERPPETATKMIQIYVSQLRKVLPDGVLLTRPGGYALEVAPEAFDLYRFERLRSHGRAALQRGDPVGAAERLRAALDVWRGPALAEFTEPFAVAQRVRLDELRLGCLEDRIEADLALGRHADVVAELELQIARHPLRERLRGQLMLALYRCGRHAEALATYQAYRRTLDEELGIDPSARLRELESEILAHDPGLMLPRSAPATLVTPRTAPVRDRPVGRDEELARLHAALDAAVGGRRRVVLVTGEPGVGKTTLVEAFLAEVTARTRALVARGQCLENHGEGEAFLPLLDALGRLARGPAHGELLGLLTRRAPTWAIQMPWLLEPDELELLHHRARGTTRDRMLREMLETLEEIAEVEPLVLVLEDLHWSDPSTLDLLAAVARRTQPARLVVIATGRSGASALDALARELTVRLLCDAVALAPLDQAAATAWLGERLGAASVPSGLARLLRERSGGNPLFMSHLLDHWLAQGLLVDGDRLEADLGALAHGLPASLRASVEDRLAGLDPDETELLEAAAVVGSEFSLGVVAAALERPASDVALGTRGTLANRRTLIERRGEGRFGFIHDVHREVLYDRVPVERRVVLHRRIGAQLEADGAPASALAAHFVAGRDHERAVRCLEVAAHQAFARTAHPEGIRHLRTALDEVAALPQGPERTRTEVELLSSLGQAQVATGGWSEPAAEEALLRARELAERLEDNEPLVSLLLVLATLYEVRGQFAVAGETLEAAARLTPDGRQKSRLEWRDLVACNLFHQGSFARALEEAEDGVALFAAGKDAGEYSTFPATLGDNAGVSCHDWAALAQWFLGRPDQALERALHAVELARDPSRAHSIVPAQAQLAIIHQCRLEPEPALAAAEATIIDASLYGYAYRVAMGRIVRGWAMAALGDTAAGAAELRAGLDAARGTGARMDEPHYLAMLADVHRRAGALDDGLAAVAAALEIVRRERSRFYAPELLRLRGTLLLALGDEAGAEASLNEAYDVAGRLGARSLELRAATSLARLWRQRGAEDRGRRLLAPLYGAFTEGHETPDLRAAAALLEPAVA
jgi:DNA-binding SARP family transcriptional activator